MSDMKKWIQMTTTEVAPTAPLTEGLNTSQLKAQLKAIGAGVDQLKQKLSAKKAPEAAEEGVGSAAVGAGIGALVAGPVGAVAGAAIAGGISSATDSAKDDIAKAALTKGVPEEESVLEDWNVLYDSPHAKNVRARVRMKGGMDESAVKEWFDKTFQPMVVHELKKGHPVQAPGGQVAVAEEGREKPEAVEAYGVKGLKSKQWRKTFKSMEALHRWAEKNDAEIYATRKVEGGPIDEAGSVGTIPANPITKPTGMTTAMPSNISMTSNGQAFNPATNALGPKTTTQGPSLKMTIPAKATVGTQPTAGAAAAPDATPTSTSKNWWDKTKAVAGGVANVASGIKNNATSGYEAGRTNSSTPLRGSAPISPADRQATPGMTPEQQAAWDKMSPAQKAALQTATLHEEDREEQDETNEHDLGSILPDVHAQLEGDYDVDKMKHVMHNLAEFHGVPYSDLLSSWVTSPDGMAKAIEAVKDGTAEEPMMESKKSKKKLAESHAVHLEVGDHHEVAMVQAELYKIVKAATELHNLLENIPELEGWVQAKIAVAADYVSKVRDHMEYEFVQQHQELNSTPVEGPAETPFEPAPEHELEPEHEIEPEHEHVHHDEVDEEYCEECSGSGMSLAEENPTAACMECGGTGMRAVFGE